MSVNLSNFNVSDTSTKVVEAEKALANYSSPAEMAAQIRHTQVGQIASLAALTMLVLYIYIAYKHSDDDKLQVLAFVTFALVETFILSLFRFQVI